MNTKLTKEQSLLCMLLCQALTGEAPRETASLCRQADIKKVLQAAQQHKVLPLLYEAVCENGRVRLWRTPNGNGWKALQGLP